MTRLAVAVALLLGVASGERITGRSPSFWGDAGGVEMQAVPLLRSGPDGSSGRNWSRTTDDFELGVSVRVDKDVLRVGDTVTFTVILTDASTGDQADPSMFNDQIIVGVLFEQRTVFTRPTEVERFFSVYESLSEFPVEVTVDEPVLRYTVFFSATMVPDLMYAEGGSERFIVYPADAPELEDDAITKTMELTLRGRPVPGLEIELEDAVLEWLMDTFDMAEYGVLWGVVTIQDTRRKGQKVQFEVSGPEDQITEVIEAVREELKSRPELRIENECSRRPFVFQLKELTEVTE